MSPIILTLTVVQDTGSSNFWYAPVLYSFFRSTELLGIEVDGHRICVNGYSRLDYTRGYIQYLLNTLFVVADYTFFERPANIRYPFVTPDPVLAWRMPLSVFAPHTLFSQIARNLISHGRFVMINQGQKEATIAPSWRKEVGLTRQSWCESTTPLRLPRPSVLTVWRHSQR